MRFAPNATQLQTLYRTITYSPTSTLNTIITLKHTISASTEHHDGYQHWKKPGGHHLNVLHHTKSMLAKK
nr:hypothetical protein HmN_000244900 [Hymenolepis microstoma]